jgi:hypothetical protein
MQFSIEKVRDYAGQSSYCGKALKELGSEEVVSTSTSEFVN